MIGSLVFVLIAGSCLLALPRRWAAMPLLLAAAYTTRMPIVQIGPASLSVLRILVVIGFIRILLKGERITNGLIALDRLILFWATLLVAMSAFHSSDAWTLRLGMVWGDIGTYFLLRVFIQDLGDVERLFSAVTIGLLPLALLMLYEKYAQYNPFEIMGGPGLANIREGHVRAYGPFAHAILAGTVGAACLPMALYLWGQNRLQSVVGLAATLGIVYACTSSGPLMMAGFGVLGLYLWKMRSHLQLVRWTALVGICALQIVMKDPVYFLMARIDITGGSQGWYRAQLIRSSLQHLDEWWLAGTDYTRHWMVSGIPANANNTDITNHLLAMGVLGGLPLLAVFVAVLVSAFRAVGRAMRQLEGQPSRRQFLAWTLGAILFAHVANFWAISLFDQSVVFLYLTFATIAAALVPERVAAGEAVVTPAVKNKELRVRAFRLREKSPAA